MQIHLKKGEKIYINGAIIKADHRCSIELLNNVNFLLGSRIMQEENAITPIKKIYFVVQTMLTSPEDVVNARQLYWRLSKALHSNDHVPRLLKGLLDSDSCVKGQRYYDSLKILRGLFDIETAQLCKKSNGP